MRPRVLFLTASYPTPEIPALGIFVKEHARAVAAHCDVAVVHIDRSPGARGLRTIAKVPGEEFPTWRIRYPESPNLVSYLGNAAAALAGYRAVRRHGFEPDLIHAHFFLAGVPAAALARVHRKPFVVTEQWSVFLPGDPATLTPLVRRAAKFAFTRADVVMPVSEALRQGIVDAGIEARFHVVPNVVDRRLFHPPASFRPPNGRPAQLLAVGAMYEAKGWEYLLEAVALLARERRDFRLEIVGDGERRADYEELAARLELGDLVSFRGYRPKTEVAELMRSSDLFVITSRYDSNPCAVIEALATGLPVVATAVGGIPEQVTDGMGLLAEPRNPQSIARQLGAALDGRDRFDRAAIAESARVRFGAEHVGRELAAIYAEQIERRAR